MSDLSAGKFIEEQSSHVLPDHLPKSSYIQIPAFIGHVPVKAIINKNPSTGSIQKFQYLLGYWEMCSWLPSGSCVVLAPMLRVEHLVGSSVRLCCKTRSLYPLPTAKVLDKHRIHCYALKLSRIEP